MSSEQQSNTERLQDLQQQKEQARAKETIAKQQLRRLINGETAK